jgi:hypothetical protein
MNWKTFDTPITETGDALIGPWRTPVQMLAAQEYDAHASIHDDSTAQKLGFRGGTIEGPTHFSQFAASDAPVATMLLNSAIIKQSYSPYHKQHAELYQS